MADKADSKTTTKLEAKSNKAKKIKDGSSTLQSNSRPNSRTVSRDNTPKPTTPKSSREGTPKTGTPKSSRGNTPKPSTPKPMPKYQYDKEELLKFRRSPLSNKIPVCLDKYKDILPDIILSEPLKNLDVQVRDAQTGDITVIRFEDDIDPEHWYKHIHLPRDDSRGNSPLTLSGPRPLERKPRHLENDSLFKRKDASRDDEDGGGIVLGPQRKSFDTGCHVSTLGKDGLRSDRTNTRRIGSGRIAMRHDSVDEERGSRRELPQLEELRKQAARERRSGFNDRGFSNRRDYDYRDDDRDFGDRRYDRRRDYRRHDSVEPEEPEWFSAGPTSQMDTIELRGFEDPRREARHGESRNADDEYECNDEAEEENHDKTEGCVSVADRNGSLETNESSSPETSHEDYESKANTTAGEIVEDSGPIQQSTTAQFDFNDLFNLDNIPGLNNLIGAETEMVPQMGAGGSRFSQWFQGSNTPVGSRGPASKSNSRRSSITEEFSYLHELINGSKSPAIASPEPDDVAMRASPVDKRMLAMRASPVDKRLTAHPAIMQLLSSVERQQHINQIYHAQQVAAGQGQPKLMPQGALNVSDVEASIKSLILAGAKHESAPQTNIPNPAYVAGHSNRVTTVAELEQLVADRQAADTSGDMAAFNRLLGMVKGVHHTPATSAQQVTRRDSPRSVTPTMSLQASLQQVQPQADVPDKSVLQKLLQHQQAQHQQQLNLQAQATKQLQMKHLQQQQQQTMLKQLINQAAVPASQTAVVPGQPPAAAIVSGAQAAGMVKSPIPPPLNLQAPASVQARAPSPLLPPTSPRAPSPIMFGSQPPMHLTAPSPIHAASQLPRSPSPNTLQVTPSATRRVPSPQELHTHAQAIMQNALIKKQLEGQKQRFLQKQQQQVTKSPSPSVEKSAAEGAAVSQPGHVTGNPDVRTTATPTTSANMTSTPATTKASLNPAFTPTSVIRKMANDKMEEKEKQAEEDHNTSMADKPAPVMKLHSDTTHRDSRTDTSGHPQDASRRSSQQSDAGGNISITVPSVQHTPQTPADSQAQNELHRLQAQFNATMEHVQSGKPVPSHLQAGQSAQPSSQAQKAPRPLVGQGAMNNALTHPSPLAASQPQVMNQTPPQGVGLPHQLNQTPQSVAMQQLSNQTPSQAVATQQPPLSNQTPPTPQQLAHLQQMQHQHMVATSQAMALQHGAQMIGPISQPLSSHSNVQSVALASSQSGRAIVKGIQPSIVNTISPPSNRPTTSITQQTPRTEQPAQNQTTPAIPTAHLPGQPMPAHVTPGQAVHNQRPIVGNSGMAGKGGSQVVQDSVRLAEQARMAQIQAQLQAGAHMSKGSPFAMTVAGNRVPVQMSGLLPVQLTPQQHQQAAVANALLLQRMMLPPTAQGLHPQQLAALQAAQLTQQQHQQRNLDNRAAARTNPAAYPASSVQATPSGRGIHGQGAGPHAVVGRSVSPQQQAQMLASMHAKQENTMGRPGMAPGSQTGDGLAKFFGTDLLKQQLGAMPPLPNQGQSIMTVEEIERRQQTVTN